MAWLDYSTAPTKSYPYCPVSGSSLNLETRAPTTQTPPACDRHMQTITTMHLRSRNQNNRNSVRPSFKTLLQHFPLPRLKLPVTLVGSTREYSLVAETIVI